MKLTQDHLPLLHTTRALIDSGEFIYICNAIDTARRRIDYSYVAEEISKTIHEGLSGVKYSCSPTLEAWLAVQLGIHWYRLSPDTMRLARLAWLDKLIWEIEHAE
jgi:hypothetical protein